MDYNHIKAIHIIFVVSWFAGLFYLPRLFVYHTEANNKPELERDILQKEYRRMEKVLFNAIMIPAMVNHFLRTYHDLLGLARWFYTPRLATPQTRLCRVSDSLSFLL
jgi:uncharacterized integral membrane protein (TIGR00701 family)